MAARPFLPLLLFGSLAAPPDSPAAPRSKWCGSRSKTDHNDSDQSRYDQLPEIRRDLISAVPKCRFCGQEHKKLVKAHIIPRSLFKLISKSGNYSVYFEVRKAGVKTAYKQAGIYDESILCEGCEARFTPWDTHGCKVITRPRGGKDIYRDPQGYECGFVLHDADYNLLRRFLLSVLWRASVSSLPFFKGVDLGPYEDRIREILRTGEPLDAETYSSILIHPIGQQYPGTILRPWRDSVNGQCFYRLYFPDITALIKVDKRRTPTPFDKVQLHPEGENYIIFLPYGGTQEERFYTDMKTFMRKHKLFGTKPRKS